MGFFVTAAKHSENIRDQLGLTETENVVTCLALGYPDVEYVRTVPRKKAVVEWR